MDFKVGDRVYIYKKLLPFDKIEFNKDNLGIIKYYEKYEELDWMSLDYEVVKVYIQLDSGKNIQIKLDNYEGLLRKYKFIKLEDLKMQINANK